MRFLVLHTKTVGWNGNFPMVEVRVKDKTTKETTTTTITVRKLVGDGDGNSKLSKNPDGLLITTCGLSMLPARTGKQGVNLCGDETAGCLATCLAFQGRAAMWSAITIGRAARTHCFTHHLEWFVDRLDTELTAREAKLADGETLACRLNMFTDIRWEKLCPGLLERHPNVTFYDYSKHVDRGHGWILPNYHLSISHSEKRSDADNSAILHEGGNVVVVFDRHVPEFWNGYPVVDGDRNDFRFLDPPGTVVGLKLKAFSSSVRESSRRHEFVQA